MLLHGLTISLTNLPVAKLNRPTWMWDAGERSRWTSRAGAGSILGVCHTAFARGVRGDGRIRVRRPFPQDFG